MEDLVARFVARLPAAAELGGPLGDALRELLATAEAAHPGVVLDHGRFLETLASVLPPSGDLLRSLRALRVADLYVAGAAAAGDPRAVARVEAMLSAETDAAAASLRASRTLTDEVAQRLRAHLLAGTAERAPAIGDYAGRGDLRAFLRISATRECLRVMRGERREVGMEADDLSYLAPVVDPELERLKRAYRGQFTECFVEALASLTPRERTLLRHHVIDRLTIDQIGALYGAHRATAARWIDRARQKLGERTEELLAARLSVDAVEVASVIRLVRSQLDVTLERLLVEDR